MGRIVGIISVQPLFKHLPSVFLLFFDPGGQ